MTELKEQLSPDQQVEREQLAAAFRAVLALTTGKRLVFWMLEQCAIYQDAFTGDNNATNYTLGLQAAGRRLIAKMDEVDPHLYPDLLRAAAEIREMDRAEAAARAKPENDDDEE